MHVNLAHRARVFITAAALCSTLNACVDSPSHTVTDYVHPTALLRSLPATSETTPMLTPSFVAPTPAPIGPTATPHTYSLRSGDTLIVIAEEHGVTVEALQLVNAGIDPLALQVGHKLIIPFAGADATTGYLPSPTPIPLSLSAFNCHPSPSGGQICLGEAHNNSKKPVINLAAQVTVVLPDGTLGPSQVTFATAEIVMPGESTPLAARFKDVGTVWGADARVVAAQDGTTLTERFLSLTIDSASGDVSTAGYYTVAAEIANNSAQEALAIVVLISGYNAKDELRSFRIVELEQGLLSGNSTKLEATFTVPAKEIRRFEISARARTKLPS